MKDGIKTLVAYDGSDYSKKALREALDISERFQGSVTLLNVYWKESREESLSLLRETEEILKEYNIIYEFRNERDFNPPKIITRIAEDEDFDLISIGCAGVGGARSWLLGSVSKKVAEDARCPVLIAK